MIMLADGSIEEDTIKFWRPYDFQARLLFEFHCESFLGSFVGLAPPIREVPT